MKKDTRNCLHILEELCSNTNGQAKLLLETTKANGLHTMAENKKKSDAILEDADKKKLLLIKQLSKAFVTPIDREDILMSALLVHKLGFMLNEIFTQITSQNLTSLGEVFVGTSELLLKSCEVLKGLFCSLSTPYSDTITEKHIFEMAQLRQNGIKLHFECVNRLFSDIQSPYALVIRQSIYEKIKECCDFSCDICDYLICVIIKNT